MAIRFHPHARERMKRSAIFTSLLMFIACGSAYAWHSVDYDQSYGNPFSEEFTKDYHVAQEESGLPESLVSLTEMLTKYKKPQEQSEIEMTLGMIYNQQDGLVDYSKAVEHFGKALGFDLPPTVLVDVHLLRGNSYELLKQTQDALIEYLRGVSVCLCYDLPAEMPEPPVVGVFNCDGPTNDPIYLQRVEEQRKQLEHRKQVMFQRKMLRVRYYLIDATKRVTNSLQLDENQIRKTAEPILKDDKRIQKFIVLITSPNKRPWK